MKRRSFFLSASGSTAVLSGMVGCREEKNKPVELPSSQVEKSEEKITLRGITWNHTRGYVPMAATSQRYQELHPDVEITWDKRSLQEFADHDLEALVQTYDLLVIDHPWAGSASEKGILLPLNDYLPEAYLKDQEKNTVGKSYISYRFGGKQWALAIDAATPVASYRPDLLEKKGEKVPQTWEELFSLAKKVKMAMAGIPIDVLMNFYMLCVTRGGKLFQSEETVVDEETGVLSLRQLRELAGYMSPEIFEWNPIKVYDAMSTRDDIAYCPFAYGYSNYSREGYARHRLEFTDLVSIDGFGPLHSTLGGTGIAVSSRCTHKEIAVDYAGFTAGPECQRTIYYYSGGQPGHRKVIC